MKFIDHSPLEHQEFKLVHQVLFLRITELSASKGDRPQPLRVFLVKHSAQPMKAGFYV